MPTTNCSCCLREVWINDLCRECYNNSISAFTTDPSLGSYFISNTTYDAPLKDDILELKRENDSLKDALKKANEEIARLTSVTKKKKDTKTVSKYEDLEID